MNYSSMPQKNHLDVHGWYQSHEEQTIRCMCVYVCLYAHVCVCDELMFCPARRDVEVMTQWRLRSPD